MDVTREKRKEAQDSYQMLPPVRVIRDSHVRSLSPVCHTLSLVGLVVAVGLSVHVSALLYTEYVTSSFKMSTTWAEDDSRRVNMYEHSASGQPRAAPTNVAKFTVISAWWWWYALSRVFIICRIVALAFGFLLVLSSGD